ncbi:hypothetical protein HYS48_02175 [Candidatus Woesearchaeota archaeon]|nr:hypothetical protein [Candidatus Woesearchaeota archaeon]
MERWIPCIVFGLLLMSVVQAAEIHGTVYDAALEQLEAVIIEVNTMPKQRLVTLDGTYTLQVPSGNYTITALYVVDGEVQKTEEEIIVAGEGSYTLDLFLFPELEEDEELFDAAELDLEEQLFLEEEQKGFDLWIMVVLILTVVLTLLWLWRRKEWKGEEQQQGKEERGKAEELREDDVAEQVMDILQKAGGRMTQKDLRKEFPFSEAKISLVIAELDSKGKLEKIKKGRGNILVLKK